MATTDQFMKTRIVDVLPEAPNILAQTIYLLKKSDEEFARLYKSDLNGTKLVPFDNPDNLGKNLVYEGESAPAVSSKYLFWRQGDRLCIRTPLDGVNYSWVDINNYGQKLTVIETNQIGSMTNVSYVNNQILIVNGYGTYLFAVGSTKQADNTTTLLAANGRWLIQHYAGALLDQYVRNIVRNEMGK